MYSHFGAKRYTPVFFILAISLSLLLSVVLGHHANAASISIKEGADQAKSITTYNVLRVCINKHMYGDIKTQAASSKDATPTNVSWFDNQDPYITTGSSGDTCNQVMSNALSQWGFKADGSDFLAKIGYVFEPTGADNNNPRYHGSADGDVRLANFESVVQSVAFNSNFKGDAPLDGTAKYYAYKTSITTCQGKSLGAYGQLNSTLKNWVDTNHTDGDLAYAVISLANSDGTTSKYGYSYNKTINGTVVYGNAKGSESLGKSLSYGGYSSTSCLDAFNQVSSTAQAAATLAAKDTCKTAYNYTDTGLIDACANGASNRSNIDYCTATYQGGNNSAKRAACYAGQGNAGADLCVGQGYTGGIAMQACIKGANLSTNSDYCNITYPAPDNLNGSGRTPTDTNKANRDTCQAAFNYGRGLKVVQAPATPTSTTCDLNPATCADTTVPQSTCAIEGVGWIICPAISFMATLADSAFSFLSDNFLSIKASTVSSGSATYQVWVIMRNIANLAFVIAFLFIIFSQLTGQGIANYGIKKMLPRLVIAAILVNVSFFICQIAVDLSNILGYSLNQIFKSIGSGIALPNGAVSTDESNNWAGIAVAVLAGAGIAWGLGLSVLLPFLLGALIALIMVFVILVVREMLIILLVIVAPIAFVAFLLPNTEQWFTKWRKTFTALLLVFPMIGLLFGAASVASTTLKAATYTTDGMNGTIGKIVAAGIIALPLFLLPSLLKGSLNSAGSIGAKMNGLSSKFSKGGQGKLANSGVMKSLDRQKQTRRAQIGAGIYEGSNLINKARSGINGRLNKSERYNKLTGNYGTIRGANIEKLENEETKLAEAAIQLRAREPSEGSSVAKQFEALSASSAPGDIVRAKAAQNILMRSGSSGVASVREVIQKNESKLSEGMRSGLASNIAENHGQVSKQKAPDLLKWATDPHDARGNKIDMEQISAAAKTWGSLSARELADLPDSSFESAMKSGGVSPATLTALKSVRMRENLSDGQRAAFSNYKPPTAPDTTTTTTTTSGSATAGTSATAAAAPSVPVDPTIIQVDHTGSASVGAAPKTQSARDSQDQAKAEIIARARQQAASSAPRTRPEDNTPK